MDQLSEDQKRAIIEALSKKGVKSHCPLCGNNKFVLADGYNNVPIQKNLTGLVIGGPSIPLVIIVCDNCGFLSQHSLGVLGLLPGQAK